MPEISLVRFLRLSWNVVTFLVFSLDDFFGVLEGVFESLSESVESSSSGRFSSSLGLGSLGLEKGLSGGVSLGFNGGNELSLLLGEWVESVSDGSVGEWVLLGLVVNSSVGLLLSKFGLNLIGVDDSGKISAGHDGSVEVISSLFEGSISIGTENSVESSETTLGEDDESTEMSSWSELEDVESMDIASVNTWQVSSGSLEFIISFVVDDKWSLSQDVSSVSEFTLTGSGVSGLSDLGEIISDTEGAEGGEEGFSGTISEVVDDEWELWDVLNEMTSSHNKRGNGGSCEGSGNSMSSLGDINLSVPSSPDFKWGEHSSFSAHVTEGSLTGSGGTRSRDSWDSCYSSTSSPGFGGVLGTSLVENGVTLSSVVGKVGVDEMDKIVSDWSRKDTWHWGTVGDLGWSITLVD